MESQIQKRSQVQKTFSLEKRDTRPMNPPKAIQIGGSMRHRQRNKHYPNQRYDQRYNRNSKFLLEDDFENTTEDHTANYEFQFARFQNNVGSRNASELNFVNLNCQIVVKPGTDVSLCFLEPDVSVAWNKIAQVRYPLHEKLECPICLYPPTLPRMAQCGHVYCLACATRYIGYENEDTHKKCAICTHMFSLKEIVKVKLLQIDSVKPGDNVELSLICRSKGCTKSVPYSLWSESEAVTPVTFDDEQLMPYSKLLLAKNKDVCNIIEDEINILKSIIEISQADEWSQHEIPELERLCDSLNEELKEAYNSDENVISNFDCKLLPKQNGKSNVCSNPSEFGAIISALEIPERDKPEPTHRGRKTSTCEDQCFIYYQMSDGRDVYMHASNWQCIVREYPNRQDWPTTIKATVLDVSHMRMDLSVRKRWRYLSHISLGRAFTIVELDLRPPLISRETLNYFAPMLERLRINRQKRIKQENYLSRMKEKVENKIPQMPENFVFAAPANLEEPINLDDFVPLEGSEVSQELKASTSTPSRPSFAAVSRVGAATLVNENRILQLTKQPAVKRGALFKTGSISFNEESDWPSLSGSVTDDSFQAADTCATKSWCAVSVPSSSESSGTPWGALPAQSAVKSTGALNKKDNTEKTLAWGRKKQSNCSSTANFRGSEKQETPKLKLNEIKESVNEWPDLPMMAAGNSVTEVVWGKKDETVLPNGRRHNLSTSSAHDAATCASEQNGIDLTSLSVTLPIGNTSKPMHNATSKRHRKRRGGNSNSTRLETKA